MLEVNLLHFVAAKTILEALFNLLFALNSLILAVTSDNSLLGVSLPTNHGCFKILSELYLFYGSTSNKFFIKSFAKSEI